MRLLIEIGYEKLLLQEDADAASILRALSGATVVEEKDRANYSTPRLYAAKKGGGDMPAPQFILPHQLVAEAEAAEIDAAKTAKHNQTLRADLQATKDAVKALQEQLDAIKAAAAPPEEPNNA